jgi:hypothetical protein
VQSNDLSEEAALTLYLQLFNKEYTFEYDLLTVYKERFEKTAAQEYSEEDWFRSYGSSHVPNMISEYFTDLADGLEYYKFGSDDLLQEAFVESSESGVIVFKLVPELKVRFMLISFLNHNEIGNSLASTMTSNLRMARFS